MNKILKLSSYALCLSLLFYAGCSGGDEPKPFDCDTSDLEINLVTDSDPTSCAVNDGSIEVSASGGKSPYQFKLNNGSFGSSATFSNLGAGSFSVTVKDGNGCQQEITGIVLSAPSGPVAGATIVVDQTDCLSPNGSITVNITGGTEPYEYKIGTNAFGSSPTFTDLKAGNYVVTVLDDANCSLTINASVASETGITYDGDILQIFEAKCEFSGCHPANGDWFTYSTAFANRNIIKTKTGDGSMPKGGASAPGGALTASQKALIACWVDDGAPQN